MADAYREIYSLNEDNMDLMRKAAKGAMQTIKFKDGKLKVDSFTASGIMAVYDKINPKNKESMEKMINSGTKGQILKLQSLAMKASGRKEEVEVDEAKDYHAPMVKGKRVGGSSKLFKKSATGYNIYHKTFSGAMQHAYAHAKKKFGITVNPNEIDQKVASGPKKPSSGKTNRYGLKGDKGGIQIQVYNTGDDYELNMYKEEVELEEGAWQLPVGPKGRAGLKKLLQKPVKAKDAIDAIDPYIGDDELWDDIGELDDKNPNQDARPLIRAAMKRLKIKEDMGVYQNAISKLIGEARQLKDPKKEMMVKSKDSGVIVIDKKDFKKYEKKGYFAVEEVEVDEHKGKKKHKHPHIMTKDGELATVDEKFDRKKFDDNEDKNFHTENGVALVNMFGDAYEKRQIAQIKKDHDKRGSITSKDQKVRDALVKKYLPKLKEEVDLDEAKGVVQPTKDGKGVFKVLPRDTKGMSGKQDAFSMGVYDKSGKKLIKDWGSHPSLEGAKKFARNHGIIEGLLDEGPNKAVQTVIVMRHKDNKNLSVSVLPSAKNIKAQEKKGMRIAYALVPRPSGASSKEVKDPKEIMKLIKGGDKLNIGEDYVLTVKDKEVNRYKSEKDARKAFHDLVQNHGPRNVKVFKEEVELDEGRMKELHMYIQQKKSAEWIAKKMGLDVKTIKSLMPEETVLERVGRFLESARSDAMRAMRKSGEFKDKDDDDVTASDDDVKAASKNIIAQMRKVVSLRGNFKVEFQDGKKEKIDPKIAQSIQQKYNSMRKPADKEKFQAKIAKSKRDLLNALKESLEEAEVEKKFDKAKNLQKKHEIEKDKETKQKQTDAIKDRQTSVADAQKAKQEAEREKADAKREGEKKKALVKTAQLRKKSEPDDNQVQDLETVNI